MEDIGHLIDTQEPAELLERLQRSNLVFSKAKEPVETVIVSGVNPEPTITVYEHLLKAETYYLLPGLRLVKHLTGAGKVVLVVPKELYSTVSEATGKKGWDTAGIELYRFSKTYPFTLPGLLVSEIRMNDRIPNPGEYFFLGIEKMLAAVKILLEDVPFETKMVTIATGDSSTIERIRIGTTIQAVLESRGIGLESGKKVILGGPFRGKALYDLQVPVSAETDCIYIQDAEQVVDFPNHPCINCGRCVAACPVDLDVNLICRYAEFSFFEEARELGATACIGCGMCAVSCPAGRSLVQFIELAKEV